MSLVRTLLRAPPSFEDIFYVVRALTTRPGEIPGILRRYFARRRAEALEADPIGVRVLLQSWEAARAASVFDGRPGDGDRLVVQAPLDRPTDVMSELQFASAVDFVGVEGDPAFAALSLEAARHGLAQRASAPAHAAEARAAYVESAEIGPELRIRLRELAAGEIGSL